ncbi:hypothetical protein BH24GEM1_BH24GEM1_11630 [soil metagenome]
MPHGLRYAMRRLIRARGFTAAAVVCLALGIGANTAIFTVISAVPLQPLPFHEPDRLVGVWEANSLRRSERNTVSPANYLDWEAANTVFSGMAAVHDVSASLTGAGEPEEIPVQRATAGLRFAAPLQRSTRRSGMVVLTAVAVLAGGWTSRRSPNGWSATCGRRCWFSSARWDSSC